MRRAHFEIEHRKFYHGDCQREREQCCHKRNPVRHLRVIGMPSIPNSLAHAAVIYQKTVGVRECNVLQDTIERWPQRRTRTIPPCSAPAPGPAGSRGGPTQRLVRLGAPS
jgi:hypothetical protein